MAGEIIVEQSSATETQVLASAPVPAPCRKITKITRMVLDGFKSFGNHTELVFGDDFNVILGPNGSGKSCAPDTEVLLTDGSIVKIGDIVEKELREASQRVYLDDGVYCLNQSRLSVFTLNPETMQVEKRPVAAFVRREGEPYLYKIKTRSGKSVVTTSCHPVITFKNGCVQSEIVGNLAPGCRIAAPRAVPLEGSKVLLHAPKDVESRCSHDRVISFPSHTCSAFGRWLGLTIGDGYIHPQRIEFVNADLSLVEEWISLAQVLFNLSKPYIAKDKHSYRVIYHTRKLPAFLSGLFRTSGTIAITSALKTIPEELMQADQETVAALLSGLIDTDGYVSATTPTLELTSKNEQLIDRAQLILLRFGILSRKRIDWKYAANTVNKIRRKYATLAVEGKENLEKFTQIPIMRYLKRQRLYHWASRSIAPNPNTDVLPQETNSFVKQLVEYFNIPVKKLRKQHPRLAAYVENRCCPSRDGIKEILGVADVYVSTFVNALRTAQPDQQKLIEILHQTGIPMQHASTAIGLHPVIIGRDWATERFHARQENLMRLCDYVKEELSNRLLKAGQSIAILKLLSQSDIFWEEITGIEKVQGTPYVYDLCIFDNHNFIANNLFVHNSNVLDALCFVLGKSSSKSLRAEKTANLIYNGGKTKQPAKTAEVSLYFDNSMKVFPVPESEVKISRMVRQDGASKYKINSKTVTRSEILELLSNAKIDPDSYNIILQGDIIALVEMPTQERRKLIEDIAGIGVYEEKKQKALNELMKVDEKLNEAEIILKERQSSLRELKKDRDQAMKYKNLADSIKKNKASFLKRNIDQKNNELEQLNQKSSKFKSAFEKCQKEIQQLRSQISERKDKIKNISSEIEEKGEVELVQLQKEIENLRVGLATFRERISSCNDEVHRIEQRKEQLKSSIGELQDKLSGLDASQKELDGSRGSTRQQLDELETKIAEFKKKHNLDQGNKFEQQIEQLDKDAEELMRSLQELREKQQNALREKDKSDFQLQTIDEQLSRIAKLEQEHKAEIKQLTHTKEQFKNSVVELNDILNKDSKDAAALARSRAQLQDMREELAKLEVKQAGVQESTAGNIGFKKIMEQRSKLGEIYGTIAELGSSSSSHSLALEIAAAQKISSVVVEDDKTAAKCINFLKENKLGVVSFLPLNKIKPHPLTDETRKLLKEKGIKGACIDLIDFDPKFKSVFSFVFGNTLVVDDIEIARKIGIGKARMVTLDGDLTELSGAMIGGYRHKKTGSFKEKEIYQKVEDVRSSVAELEAKVSELDSSRVQSEEKITRLRALKASLEGEIIKGERALHLDIADIGENKDYKKELAEKIKSAESLLKSLEGQIAEKTQLLTGNKIERQKLRAQVSELRSPTILAELNAFDQKRRELTEELIKMDAEMKSLKLHRDEILGRDEANSQKLMKDMAKEKEAFAKEAKELQEKIRANESALKEKESAQQQFQSRFKGLFEERNRMSDEISAHEARLLEVEDSSRKEELQVNTFSIEEARIKAGQAAMLAEFSQYEGIELDMEKPEEQLKKEIADFEKMMANIGSVNLRALDIYDSAEKEYTVLVDKKNLLGEEKSSVVKLMDEIEGSKTSLFMNTLNAVSSNFHRIFSELTTKGEAFLELENPQKPFEQGLGIRVKLVGDKFLDIRSLSGGEKTLTALAFIFAVQEYEPASFYVLDEVDAALDKHNSEKLAKLLRKYCDNAQYIVISHNDALVMEGDVLYGVSMNPQRGLSSVVSLKA